MGASGLGLPLTPPAGPVNQEALLLGGADQGAQQASHLRRGERDQVVTPPFWAVAFAVARVTSRKAWASKQSVI